MVSMVPDKELTLKAGLWPLGQACVRIILEPAGRQLPRSRWPRTSRLGRCCSVRNKINDLILHRRNVESLRRLADIATRDKKRQP